jgi:hypothetical protein
MLITHRLEGQTLSFEALSFRVFLNLYLLVVSFSVYDVMNRRREGWVLMGRLRISALFTLLEHDWCTYPKDKNYADLLVLRSVLRL